MSTRIIINKATGPQGPPGRGIPAGGTAGQMLAKLSSTPYDVGFTNAGSGDMQKATYDPNNDGKVVAADDADQLGGQLPAYYATSTALSTETTNRINADNARLVKAQNLADVADVATTRANLGLGTAATHNTGTTVGAIPLIVAGNALPAVSGENLTNLPSKGLGLMSHWYGVRGQSRNRCLHGFTAGDSIAVGASTDDYPAHGWISLVAADSHARYGGGQPHAPSGFRGAFLSSQHLESERANFAAYVGDATGFIGGTSYWTGRGSAYVRSQTNGSRFPQYLCAGSEVWVTYGLMNSDPLVHFWRGGTFNVWIDGVNVMTIDAGVDPQTDATSTRYASITRQVATGLDDTVLHTLEIECTSAASNLTTIFFGSDWEPQTGMVWHNYSRHNATTGTWGNGLDDSLLIDANFGGYGQPGATSFGDRREYYDIAGSPVDAPVYDVGIWAVGTNDITLSGNTIDTVRTNTLGAFKHLFPDYDTSGTSLLFALPSHGITSVAGPTFDEVAGLYRGLAQTLNAGFLNLNDWPVRDWASDFDVAGGAAGSPHITNLGAQLYALAVNTLLAG